MFACPQCQFEFWLSVRCVLVATIFQSRGVLLDTGPLPQRILSCCARGLCCRGGNCVSSFYKDTQDQVISYKYLNRGVTCDKIHIRIPLPKYYTCGWRDVIVPSIYPDHWSVELYLHKQTSFDDNSPETRVYVRDDLSFFGTTIDRLRDTLICANTPELL